MYTRNAYIDGVRDPRRVAAMLLVALAHVGVVYALVNWGLKAERPPVQAPMHVGLIAEEQVVAEVKRPPQPEITVPPVYVEPPQIDIPLFAESPRSIAVTSRKPPQAADPTPAAKSSAPKLVSTVEYLEPLRPRYPPTSRRLREEGLVVLLVLVDERGTASRIEVRDSSGHSRLDRAAREAVECARFKPYREGGVAQAALVLIPVEFSLNSRIARR